MKIPKDKLEEYDRNIKGYVDRINKRRKRPIVLKYFQYLSVLFTEIFLDRYFHDPVKLLNELNDYAANIRNNDIFFSRDDLTKLAFWMATGSGKTLIMHINYLQFIKYNDNKSPHKIKLDNILLITPGEALSNQHLQEMKESSIPCDLFSNNKRGYFSGAANRNRIKVIDIHKLTEEKKGQGVTVDIEHFGNKNLIFVDEGHKGSGGVKWKGLRKKLAKEGFTFEYSATFGQAIATAGNQTETKNILQEYGKAILFDYSYRYFYEDGYGKNYRILNLKDKFFSESTKDMLMLANLLSFYEQKLLFEDYKDEIEEYNIEEPLWIFVGSKVKGKTEQSDILRIVQFLTKALKNEDWAVKSIKKILNGNSGLLDTQNRDLFSPAYPEQKLKYLKNKNLPPEDIYRDLLKRIFHIDSPAPLHLVNIKNASGEIALQAGNAEFFGVINIGDDSQFLKLVEGESGIPVEKDELTGSLFDSIKDRNSKINVLIGAKKFIEGWDCWRVSNMGLLNIGKKEGSQIIQLFGRGVRLKGKGFSLKRSSPDQNPPEYLRFLETLNIFGIKANYMELFRDHLESEGISTENYVEIELPIEINDRHLEKGLLIPHVDIRRFKKEQFFNLDIDEQVTAHIDLMPKVDIIASPGLEEDGIQATTSNPQRKIEKKYLDLLDWNKIHFTLLDYKREREWNNVVFSKDILSKVMEKELYTLYCPAEFVKPEKFEDVWRLEEIVLSILKKYVQSFYNLHKNNWTRKNMEIIPLKPDHNNLNFERYTLMIKEDQTFMISKVKSIVESELDKIYKEFNNPNDYINNVYFDRHIYQPLLIEPSLADSNNITISPQGLNEGERKFIEDLKNYFESNTHLFENIEIFVLRNLPRRGIGFFETYYFYPDFIIWVKKKDKQHLIFVEPHGLQHTWKGFHDEKIQLHKQIKELEKGLAKKTGTQNISLDSFIVSVTEYRDITPIFNKPRSILKEDHILFQPDDREHYIEKLMSVALDT